jgi:hypothetical protein
MDAIARGMADTTRVPSSPEPPADKDTYRRVRPHTIRNGGLPTLNVGDQSEGGAWSPPATSSAKSVNANPMRGGAGHTTRALPVQHPDVVTVQASRSPLRRIAEWRSERIGREHLSVNQGPMALVGRWLASWPTGSAGHRLRARSSLYRTAISNVAGLPALSVAITRMLYGTPACNERSGMRRTSATDCSGVPRPMRVVCS